VKMAKFLLLSLLSVVFLLSAGLAYAETKTGVIDVRKCIQMIEMGKAAFQDVKAERDRIQNELSEREKEIEDIRNKLEKGAGVISDSERFRLEGELNRKATYFKELYAQSQERIRALQAEMTRPILAKLGPIVEEIAKTKGYKIILEFGPGLVYFDPSVDITNEAIKIFNEKHPVATKGETGEKTAK